MNKIIKNNFTECIITIIVTSIVVVSLCFCVELELLFRSEDKVNQEELNVENLVEFCTIEQLEKYLEKNPQNYFAKIKLAGIYESLGEYKQADKLYQEALITSVRSNFSVYSYAIFCAKRGMFNLAATLAEELMDIDSKAYEYRAKIYEQIALKLLEEKQYNGVVNAYQVAYKYAKNMENSDYLKIIKEKYAKSYVDLADKNIEKGNIDDAIANLNNSLEINETNEARYKLGLIYINIDKFIAEKHISKVFKNNIFMVNPYIYNSLLVDLSDVSKNIKGVPSSDYYLLKLRAFKKRLADNYIYKNDIIIENSFITKKKGFFDKKAKYLLVFDIENNTRSKIQELFIEAIIFVDNKQYKVNKKLFSKTHPFDFYDKSIQNQILLPDDFKVNEPKDKTVAMVKYFARKNENAPWTLIKIDSLNI